MKHALEKRKQLTLMRCDVCGDEVEVTGRPHAIQRDHPGADNRGPCSGPYYPAEEDDDGEA